MSVAPAPENSVPEAKAAAQAALTEKFVSFFETTTGKPLPEDLREPYHMLVIHQDIRKSVIYGEGSVADKGRFPYPKIIEKAMTLLIQDTFGDGATEALEAYAKSGNSKVW